VESTNELGRNRRCLERRGGVRPPGLPDPWCWPCRSKSGALVGIRDSVTSTAMIPGRDWSASCLAAFLRCLPIANTPWLCTPFGAGDSRRAVTSVVFSSRRFLNDQISVLVSELIQSDLSRAVPPVTLSRNQSWPRPPVSVSTDWSSWTVVLLSRALPLRPP